MFNGLALHATIPASDFARAKSWHADKLDLTPVEEDEDDQGAWYETGGIRFLIYPSGFAGTNQATAATFRTDEFDAAIAHLRAAGVSLIDYDFEGFQTVDGVFTAPDGNRAAWFMDSEGNTLAVSNM
ncbi:MAG: VOC family protein [Acidobacteria bacterium]|nr:VOC family protein [Acidobacteriota bacterium]